MHTSSARYANIAFGLWLLISTVVWHHSHAHLVNTLVVGFTVVVSAVISFRVSGFRLVTSAAGVWLIASLFAWPKLEPVTSWHDFMIGIAIVLVSAVGPRREKTTPPKRTLHAAH
jgi:hypothetical protein